MVCIKITAVFIMIFVVPLCAMQQSRVVVAKNNFEPLFTRAVLQRQKIMNFLGQIQADGRKVNKLIDEGVIAYALRDRDGLDEVRFLYDRPGKERYERVYQVYSWFDFDCLRSHAQETFDLFRQAYAYQEILKQEKQEDQKEEQE
ncbi:MAG TPA: hypothetical protein VGT41_06640 [Candidatus Babeliales bacterium]|nr:hypothetical protein [Candidatus Babeliales bacterium]